MVDRNSDSSLNHADSAYYKNISFHHNNGRITTSVVTIVTKKVTQITLLK